METTNLSSANISFEEVGLAENHRHVTNESLRSRRLRITVLAILALCVSLVVLDSLTSKHLETVSVSFVQWVEHNPIQGVIAVVLVYIVATICFVPGSILTIGTGYAFGSAFNSTFTAVCLASTAVFLGASVGSMCSFLLGRYLFRAQVIRLAESYSIFQAVDRALEAKGLTIMILLRLSPLIPYNALDYISGVTAISFRSYSLALIGILPGTIMFVAVGATASSLVDGTSKASNGNLQTVALVFGVVFAVAGTLAASYYSKLELDQILRENEENNNALLVESSADLDTGPRESVVQEGREII